MPVHSSATLLGISAIPQDPNLQKPKPQNCSDTRLSVMLGGKWSLAQNLASVSIFYSQFFIFILSIQQQTETDFPNFTLGLNSINSRLKTQTEV